LIDAFRRPGRHAGVAHFVPLYLPRTETFIYSVLTHHRRYRPIVLAQNRVETAELFPFPHLYVDAEVRSRWSADTWYRRIALLRGRRYGRWESLLDRHAVGIMHAHFGHTGAETVRLFGRYGLRQVTSFYGWDDTVALGDPVWRERFDRLFAEGAVFLVEGSHIARRLAERGGPADRIRVHRIGIDVGRIRFRPPAPPLPGNPARLLFCGRFVEKKGLADAISAVAAVASEGFAVQLRVIGDGPLRPEVERQIAALGVAPQVRLLGAARYEDFTHELESCDLFVQPSVTAADGDTEGGAPTVLIEAQAAGKPVLSTIHADIPEIVVPGSSAVLVPERSPELLAAALRDLLREPERWIPMGRAGREHVERQHEIGTQMEKLEALYDELTSPAAARG
jgi:colanic acid/amylovoran biosynthesis glycosyltransferase